jgi:hypothetical protein
METRLYYVSPRFGETYCFWLRRRRCRCRRCRRCRRRCRPVSLSAS